MPEEARRAYQKEAFEFLRNDESEAWVLYLPLLDTILAFDDLAKNLPEGSKHRDYLLSVIGYVNERTPYEVDEEGHERKLTLDEADWLNDELTYRFEAAKKKRQDELAELRKSPSSTES